MAKLRLDQILLNRHLAQSRDEAQRLIRSGKVLVQETVADKPGAKFAEDVPIRLTASEIPYVSRGGLKLAAALRQFNISVAGRTAADLGASTGGFTDCLLQHGARKVYAVDVGYGQLAYTLQTDPRVIVRDRTNCRHLTVDGLGESVDLIVADLSFISVKTVFPAIQRIVKPDGFAILLIKPQFEIGKGRVGKKGIVRSADDHAEVLRECRDFFQEAGWGVRALLPSPITGKSGNIEFLLWIQPETGGMTISDEQIQDAVRQAHEQMDRQPECIQSNES